MTYKQAYEDSMRRFYMAYTLRERRNKRKKSYQGYTPSKTNNDLAGNILHISIPAGAEIELLNLFELASPSGVSLDARLPFLGGTLDTLPPEISSIINSIRQAGGTVEVGPS